MKGMKNMKKTMQNAIALLHGISFRVFGVRPACAPHADRWLATAFYGVACRAVSPSSGKVNAENAKNKRVFLP
jgi:hypothetical protein